MTDADARDDEMYRMAKRVERIATALAKCAAQLADLAESNNRVRLETLACIMRSPDSEGQDDTGTG
jgi:uncharacterized protein Yka (UPF0111/DUF47 family)